MAGRKGAAAWAEYFKGRDVETVIKEETRFLEEDGKPTTKVLKPGTKVLVHKVSSYNPKALITVPSFKKKGRCTFDKIQKPNKAAQTKSGFKKPISLKPQGFGIKEQPYTLRQYVELLLDGIDESKLPARQKAYLTLLVNYFNKKATIGQLRAFDLRGIPIAEIEKDFGECLGPIEILNNATANKRHGMVDLDKKSTRVFFPTRANEPLMDYALITPTNKYILSAKAEGSSNTVKPADVLYLLKKKGVENNYRNRPEYIITETIANTNYGTINGPSFAFISLAAAKLQPFAKLAQGKVPPSLTTLKKKDNIGPDIMTVFKNFISQNDYLKKRKRISAMEFNYEIEHFLEVWSKNNYIGTTKMFNDAISGAVIYVKFSGIEKQMPKFSVVSSFEDGDRPAKVYFRSKAARNRSEDKLGFQT